MSAASSSSGSSSRSFLPLKNKYDRVILLVDMDCFFCQVEEKLDPSLQGKPVAVVQHNAWRDGGIIAVNYPARAKGVTRHMRGDDAKKLCPDIQLVRVPALNDKADLGKYREAGKEVANVLDRFTNLVERASVDEAYLDLTAAVQRRCREMDEGAYTMQPEHLVNTFTVGFRRFGDYIHYVTANYTNRGPADENLSRIFSADDLPAARSSDLRLLIGATIATEIRSAIKKETGYDCSAGIAHNKILAKLACGFNKPDKQTILPLTKIPELFETLPVGKIKGLGGKFGDELCQQLGIRFLGELKKFSLVELQRRYEERNGTWLFHICRGIDLEIVNRRVYAKSIGCCKKFPGRHCITGINTLRHWLTELANEISDRLDKDFEENTRVARNMILSYTQEIGGQEVSGSRSAALISYDRDSLVRQCMEILQANNRSFCRQGSETVLNNPIKYLGISAGRFKSLKSEKGQNMLQEMFARQKERQEQKKKETSEETPSTLITKTMTSPLPLSSTTKSAVGGQKSDGSLKSFFAKFAQHKAQGEVKTQETGDSKGGEGCEKNLKTERDEKGNQDVEGNKNFKVGECDNAKPVGQATEENVTDVPNLISEDDIEKFYQDVEGIKPELFETNVETSKEAEKEEKQSEEESDRENCLDSKESSVKLEPPEICKDAIETSPDFENIFPASEELIRETAIDKSISDSQHCASHPASDQGTKRKLERSLTPTQPAVKKPFRPRYASYAEEYAEYMVPDLRLDLVKCIECEKCGEKIPNDASLLQTHQDHHFAQELRELERQEFRQMTKSQTPSQVGRAVVDRPTASSNSNHHNRKSSTKDVKINITKFFQPKSNDDSPSPSGDSPPVDLETETICKICRKTIKNFDLPEHMDYHVAKDMQRQLNLLEVRTVHVAAGQTKIPATNGRKKPLSQQPTGSSKPITSFFSQEPI